jgi:hypothetical protein
MSKVNKCNKLTFFLFPFSPATRKFWLLSSLWWFLKSVHYSSPSPHHLLRDNTRYFSFLLSCPWFPPLCKKWFLIGLWRTCLAVLLKDLYKLLLSEYPMLHCFSPAFACTSLCPECTHTQSCSCVYAQWEKPVSTYTWSLGFSWAATLCVKTHQVLRIALSSLLCLGYEMSP